MAYELHLNHPDRGIAHTQRNFKSGEGDIKITQSLNRTQEVNILLSFHQDNMLIRLFQATDALRRKGMKDINLYLPYMPGSRQDRVMNNGESLGVKVYADLINSQGYKSVHVFDPHSDVTAAVLNNVVVHNNHEFVSNVLWGRHDTFTTEVNRVRLLDNVVLISPDAGSLKKIYGLAEFLNNDVQKGNLQVVRCDKLRDTTSGKLGDAVVYADDLTGKTCVIIDDVISGGKTFMILATELKKKNAARVYLIVSAHEGVAVASKLKESGIDGVFTTNAICDLNEDNYLKTYNVFAYMGL